MATPTPGRRRGSRDTPEARTTIGLRAPDWSRSPISSGAAAPRVAHTFADSGPVPERELAQRAGLGWVGKNTMLIRPQLGLVLPDRLRVHRSALTPSRVNDRPLWNLYPLPGRLSDRRLRRGASARRHAMHLLPHHRAQGTDPRAARARLDGWVFGCDICNEVCPWNQRFASPGTVEAFRSREALEKPMQTFSNGWIRPSSTPVWRHAVGRTGLEGMRRNFRAAFGGRDDD